MSVSWLVCGLFFGIFGFGYFIYGKKQEKLVPLLCGLALMFFPYFVSGTLPLIGIGIGLMAIPYFVRD